MNQTLLSGKRSRPISSYDGQVNIRRFDKRFWRFSAVGVAGFAVDGGVLTALMTAANFGAYEARLISFSMAVTVTWWLNRRLTFRDGRRAAAGRQFALYFGIQIIGALSNLAVFALLLETVDLFQRLPILALTVGAVVGLCVNYAGSARYAFARSGERIGRTG